MRLVDKSLVVAEEGGEGSLPYRLLETLRHHARDRLNAHGETADVHARHAQYYVGLAEHGEQGLKGAEQVLWLQRLDAAYVNCWAATHWLVENGQAEEAARLAGSL